MMKPALFRTEMVWRLMQRKKSQTRRSHGLKTVNQAPDAWRLAQPSDEVPGDTVSLLRTEPTTCLVCSTHSSKLILPIPWPVGTVLYVRETWAPTLSGETEYRAGNGALHRPMDGKWRPSLFMPRERARFFLTVTRVRLQRLLDISHDDAIAEGAVFYGPSRYSMNGTNFYTDPVRAFLHTFRGINVEGPDNPWTLAYTFDVTGGPLA